ncbi:MAG: hypothetical protein U9R05_10275, partial [Chloroflexota bacterium]|nr:hypothetical protein [Chloroflexota bacterium]
MKKKTLLLSLSITGLLFLALFISISSPANASGGTPPPDAVAITSFVPPQSMETGYECALPYFSAELDKLPTSLHIMNTDETSTMVNLYLWGPDGGEWQEATLITRTLPPHGSTLIAQDDFYNASLGEILTGTGWVTATGNIACLVKATPGPVSPNYLMAYTPRPDTMAYGLLFPWIGTEREDLHPIVYLQNGATQPATVTLQLLIGESARSTVTVQLQPHALLTYDPVLDGGLDPTEFGMLAVNSWEPGLAGYLALLDETGAPVEAWPGSPNITTAGDFT